MFILAEGIVLCCQNCYASSNIAHCYSISHKRHKCLQLLAIHFSQKPHLCALSLLLPAIQSHGFWIVYASSDCRAFKSKFHNNHMHFKFCTYNIFILFQFVSNCCRMNWRLLLVEYFTSKVVWILVESCGPEHKKDFETRAHDKSCQQAATNLDRSTRPTKVTVIVADHVKVQALLQSELQNLKPELPNYTAIQLSLSTCNHLSCMLWYLNTHHKVCKVVTH